MANACLTLNGNQYYYEKIKTGELGHGLTGYEKAVLQFCQQWLNGQSVFFVHTSGSTGKPKRIAITRKQMATSARMTATALGLKKGDHALVCLNTEYIGGKMMLVRGLETGMQMTIISPTSNPLENISDEPSFDFTALVPLQLQTILEESPPRLDILNHMKAMILGGAAVSPTLKKDLQKITCPIYATYGMTETVSHIALQRLNGDSASNSYTAFDEVTLGQDERGCLTIKSPLTNHKTLVTNDLVKIITARNFQWLGRIDNVINSGGVKIQVEQLEAEIAGIFEQLNCEKRFFVAGIKDNTLGEKTVLVMEGGQLSKPGEKVMETILASQLQRYAVPKAFYYIPSFIATETGKIKRKENLKILGLDKI